MRETFRKLLKDIGLGAAQGARAPRMHDFRHLFAMETLIGWHRSGQDAEQRLPILAAFLGHVRYQSTYWYLSNAPGLMQQAVRRLERRWEDRT
jgi:integrase